jgi:hypothetical protein
MAGKFLAERANEASTLGSDATLHTPADTDLPINVKAVWLSADTTITFKNAAGTARSNFPAKAGVLPVVPTRITAVTSGECWLIY